MTLYAVYCTALGYYNLSKGSFDGVFYIDADHKEHVTINKNVADVLAETLNAFVVVIPKRSMA